MHYDNWTNSDNWVLQFPIWVFESNWEILPFLDDEGNIQTNIKILQEEQIKNSWLVLASLEQDTLWLINLWIWNEIEEIAVRAKNILEKLYWE